jgi:hypothetical protein
MSARLGQRDLAVVACARRPAAGLARTRLRERAEPKRRPDLADRDLGDRTDAEVLKRLPEHIAVQLGRDLGAALGVGDPEQAAGFRTACAALR